jgi:Rrf2 family protein
MLKFQKSTMIALYAMTELAKDPEERLAANTIAERFSVSVHHLSKVLGQLVRAGLVETARGAGGGYRLARAPKQITLYDVVEVFEGPHREADNCLLQTPGSSHRAGPFCALHPVIVELDEQITFTLQSISLKTLLRAAPTP